MGSHENVSIDVHFFRGIKASNRHIAVVCQTFSVSACLVSIHDEIGRVKSRKEFTLLPLCFVMDDNAFAISNGIVIILWQFNSQSHIRDLMTETDKVLVEGNYILTMTITAEQIIAARQNGMIEFFERSSLRSKQVLDTSYSSPVKCLLNCAHSRLAIIDDDANIFIFDFDNERLEMTFSEKTCLDFIWSDKLENDFLLLTKDSLLAFSDKSDEKQMIEHNLHLGESYFYSYDLSLILVNTSQIYNTNQTVYGKAAKSVTSSIQIKKKAFDTLSDRYACFYSTNNFNNSSLSACTDMDYNKISFIKSLERIANKSQQACDIESYRGNFDEAETIMSSYTRKLKLRVSLSDLKSIKRLIKCDSHIPACPNLSRLIADIYFESCYWQEALHVS